MGVTCKLWAQLGNQMFMCSAVLGYAKKHRLDYFLPPKTIAPAVWKTYFPQFPTQICPPHYFTYKEPEHSYNEIPYHKFIQLEGFFQSEKYFAHCREDILKAFQIPWKPLEGFVSIHVRRGDYLNYPDKHPVITIEYLRDSILYMAERGYRNFVVCSDDIPWCRKTFAGVEGASFSYSNNRDPIQDLALLSCAEHQICSNSSFSWWGQYLNQNPNKIVVMPEKWFGPGNSHLSTKDLYPEYAIKL